MLPDIDKYLIYLDEFDLSREEKADLIQAVWSVMETHADKAFGLHPSQQVCGYRDEFNLQSQDGLLKSK